MTLEKQVAKRIKRIMRNKQLQVKAVSIETKIDINLIYRVMRGTHTTNIRTYARIAKGLGVNLKDLF